MKTSDLLLIGSASGIRLRPSSLFGGLFFSLIFNSAQAVTSNLNTQHIKNVGRGTPRLTGGSLSKPENLKMENEKKLAHRLGLNIMENFGCSDFKEKATQALLDYLRESENAALSEEDFLGALAGHIGILNYSQIPESKLNLEKKAYKEVLKKLSEEIRVGLYRSYDDGAFDVKDASPLSPKEIADILEDKGSDRDWIKKQIMNSFDELNELASDDHWNVGCRGADVGNKNVVIVYVREKDGGIGKRLIHDFLNEKNRLPIVVVAKTAPASVAIPAPPTPQEEVRAAIVENPQHAYSGLVPGGKTALPTPTRIPTPKDEVKAEKKKERPAKHQAAPEKQSLEIKKESSPTKTTPKENLDQTAKETLQKMRPPLTTKGKGLFSRFEDWIKKRNKDKASDYYKTAEKVLASQPNFFTDLVGKNPFGKLCANFLDKKKFSDEDRKRMLYAAPLVMLMGENFDKDSVEKFKDPMNDSIGPWQTAMNTKNLGCRFNNRDEIRYSLEKNLHCLYTVLSLRSKFYGKIYGPTSDVRRVTDKVGKYEIGKTHLLHWNILIEGNGFFEEKFEPIFRKTFPECKNTYDSLPDIKDNGKRRLVNGEDPREVADFIKALI